MKPMTLSAKEIRRACAGITVVVRPQATGLYMVATIKVATGLPTQPPQFVPFSDVSLTARDQVRWLDKLSMGGDMAHASRSRTYRKNKASK